VDVLDEKVEIMPVRSLSSSKPPWMAARGDSRNSGAYPVQQAVTAVPGPDFGGRRLLVYPNPGGGQFNFRVTGPGGAAPPRLEIFDLRGRRLRVLEGGSEPGLFQWDGTDRSGRPLAAGSYLAVTRVKGERLTTRVILAR
jgi:hypothetical protein